ncbi:MAG: DUF4397 domain-containing protein, partial [Bacteroidia bacterium]|nr:DUF4397 domain-containing protein [Bacteroidia bacterium]
MKKLVFWVSLLIAGFLQAQRVQIIHNSPDPMLRTVDIWVNGGEQPILDDFPFRGATPFIDIGSLGITGNITIEIKPKNSNAQTPALLTKQIFLNSNDVKYIIANGLINTAAYANPFGYNLSADLLLVDALIESNSNDTYSLRLFHGVSDVSPVSIFLNNNLQPSVPLLTYGRASSYINMAAEVSNSIAIRIPGQNATIAQLEINSRGKGGKTGILLGSGFAFPANNNNGPFLAFFLVNPDGSTEVVNIETATVEILNNVSDPTAPGLFFGIKNLNLNIETPTSTIGYLQAYQTGVGVNNTWQIIAYDAQGNVRAVSSPFLAQRGGRYRFVLNGVVNLSNYDLSVNGTAIHVSFFEWGGSNLSNPNLGNVAFRVLHASPDAPAVNVSVRQLGVTPIKNLSYRQATEVIQLPADYYIFDISPSGVPNLVLSYAIDFNEYTNKRGIIFASGYLEPSRNQNGAEFGIYFWPEGATRATPLESIPLSWCDTPVDIRVQ